MSNIALSGIPYDRKSSYMRGPSLAPQRIREYLTSTSTNLFAENGLTIANDRIKDYGDFEINEYTEITSIVRERLESGERVLCLGGDHSITYPVLK